MIKSEVIVYVSISICVSLTSQSELLSTSQNNSLWEVNYNLYFN